MLIKLKNLLLRYGQARDKTISKTTQDYSRNMKHYNLNMIKTKSFTIKLLKRARIS